MKVLLLLHDCKYEEVSISCFLGYKIMAEKYSLKLKYSLKYSLKLIYLMSDSFDFFHSLFHIQYGKAGNC